MSLNVNETQHQVTLSKGFWLADTTVTQALWESVIGNNPSDFKRIALTMAGGRYQLERLSGFYPKTKSAG
ncbi:MAG: hypothetical protein R3E89_03890 [Thiolinea sp.]